MLQLGKSILVDAGPLIALGVPRDKHHARAISFAQANTATLITTWPVITEAAHFLKSDKRLLLEFVRSGGLWVEDIGLEYMSRMLDLIDKYPQADLADASLVLIGERLGVTDIATIDTTDFSIYRTRTGRAFRNVFPTH